MNRFLYAAVAATTAAVATLPPAATDRLLNDCAASIEQGLYNPAGREMFMVKLECRSLAPGTQARAVSKGYVLSDGERVPFEITTAWLQFAPATTGRTEFASPERVFEHTTVDYQQTQ
jgi:hypothetical protein